MQTHRTLNILKPTGQLLMKCTFSLSDQQNISNLRRGTLDAVSACTVPAQTLRESPTQGLSTVKKPECSRAASTSVLASDKANPHTQPSIYQAWLENGRHFRQSTHAATSPVGELLKEQQRRMHKHRERERGGEWHVVFMLPMQYFHTYFGFCSDGGCTARVRVGQAFNMTGLRRPMATVHLERACCVKPDMS